MSLTTANLVCSGIGHALPPGRLFSVAASLKFQPFEPPVCDFDQPSGNFPSSKSSTKGKPACLIFSIVKVLLLFAGSASSVKLTAIFMLYFLTLNRFAVLLNV